MLYLPLSTGLALLSGRNERTCFIVPTYSLKRFTSPDALRAVSIDCLLGFLSSHAEFLTKRGLDLATCSGNADLFDYSLLVDILMNPDADTPKDLIDALYYVHEVSTLQGMDFLLSEAEKRGISFDSQELTPIDVAMRMWLYGSDIVERAHARDSMYRPRTFAYFQTQKRGGSKAVALDSQKMSLFESDLDDWFVRRQRGRGTRVFQFEQNGEIWFLIRHGEPFKREGILEDGKSSCVFYRPERYDIAVYNSRLNDLRIHAGTKGEVLLYQTLLGRHLFCDDGHFPCSNKYTLDPLRTAGAASLVCSDISGIESVTLCELEFEEGGLHNRLTKWKCADIFEMLNCQDEKIPIWARFTKAVFKIVFTGSKTARTVCIRPSNIAQFQRDGDVKLIERWLEAREFVIIVEEDASEYEESDELLVAV